ncbi:hypothetical protein JHK86_030261 [Glycine max]|nr:hypothetical protein JHK86_030261 [Glycine max]
MNCTSSKQIYNERICIIINWSTEDSINYVTDTNRKTDYTKKMKQFPPHPHPPRVSSSKNFLKSIASK